MVLSVERRENIRNILLERKSVTVAEMAGYFQVSTETIRRDFDFLQQCGFLDKTYGGASIKEWVSNTVPQQIKSGILVEIKRRMVKQAAAFLNPNDSIFLDHSTTVYEMCREIEHIPLTVMTNSIFVINHFAHNPLIKLVIPGGNLDINTQGLFGMETIDFLERHYLDKVFFSCRGINMRQGLSDSEEQVAVLRRTIIKRAQTTYLLADHTKFGKPSFIDIAGFDQVDYLITDEQVPDDWAAFLRSQDIRVVECLEKGETNAQF
jgi:DeoR/GlpR family transcriptional regulator of sugar metabolism